MYGRVNRIARTIHVHGHLVKEASYKKGGIFMNLFPDWFFNKEEKEKQNSNDKKIVMDINEKLQKDIDVVWKCAFMIEKYHYMVFMRDANTISAFKGEDMDAWKTTFYKQLVQSNMIPDTVFFDPKNTNPNIGVGADGAFSRAEYINFRYQLYYYLYQAYMQNNEFKNMIFNNPLYACLTSAILIMEPYVKKFNPKARDELFTFAENDMMLWKQHFYPVLVESSLLSDYSIFDPISLRKNYGIGSDGVAFCWELQHFISEAYRYMLLPQYIQSTHILP